MPSALLTSLCLVFLAEIADKTMLVTLSYAMETKHYVRILVVSTFAFTVANILSVEAGYLTRLYIDQRLLNITAGILLAIVGILIYTSKEGREPVVNRGRGICTYFLAVLICEMGDKTQLAMFSSSAIHGEPIFTLLGGAIGYMIANALGVLLVVLLSKFVSLFKIKKFTAFLMIVVGVLMTLRAILEMVH